MVVRAPPPRSLTMISGGGVTVTAVPPMTVTTVAVVGLPGVDTANSVTDVPSTTAMIVLVSAMKPSSDWTTSTMDPPTTPVTVWTIRTGGFEMTVVTPAEFVVVRGGGVDVDVISIAVVVPSVISGLVLKSGSNGSLTVATANAVVTVVVPVSGYAVVLRPLSFVEVVPCRLITIAVGSPLTLTGTLVVIVSTGAGGAPSPFG